MIFLLNTKSKFLPLQSLWQIHKSIHSLTLNFTIMKKQILILLMIFTASISTAWSQALPGSAPRPLIGCVGGPLNPIAGVPYDYSAVLNPAGGTAFWFATFNNTSFISGDGELTTNQEPIGGDFISVAINYQNDVPGATDTTTTTITWNSIGLAQVDSDNPLFLALNYSTFDTGCANNLKVFRLNPINAFMVNILNVDAAGYDEDVASCFSDIKSAEYDLANSIMVYDFGQNMLAFEVVAANFTDFYDVSFRIEGLQPEQDANIYWSYSNDFAGATQLAAGPFGNGIVQGPTVLTEEPSTQNGVSVFVWLEVNNNNFEGLSDTPITLAVAGLNSANQSNIRWDDCSILVSLTADLGDPNAPDFANHILQSRPTVLPADGLTFEN